MTTNTKDEGVALITQEEAAKIEKNFFTEAQMKFLTQPTPANEIYKRAKEGREFSYVKTAYAEKVLNLMFGFRWDFVVTHEEFYESAKEVVVKGQLTVYNSEGNSITKTNFGTSEVTGSIGEALKAAASDCTKKCASKLGLFSDVYGRGEGDKAEKLTSVQKLARIKELLAIIDKKNVKIYNTDRLHIERIIEEKEVKSYDKTIAQLEKKLPKEE